MLFLFQGSFLQVFHRLVMTCFCVSRKAIVLHSIARNTNFVYTYKTMKINIVSASLSIFFVFFSCSFMTFFKRKPPHSQHRLRGTQSNSWRICILNSNPFYLHLYDLLSTHAFFSAIVQPPVVRLPSSFYPILSHSLIFHLLSLGFDVPCDYVYEYTMVKKNKSYGNRSVTRTYFFHNLFFF